MAFVDTAELGVDTRGVTRALKRAGRDLDRYEDDVEDAAQANTKFEKSFKGIADAVLVLGGLVTAAGLESKIL